MWIPYYWPNSGKLYGRDMSAPYPPMGGWLQDFKEKGPCLSIKSQIPWFFTYPKDKIQLSPERKQAVCSILFPSTGHWFQEFLGAKVSVESWSQLLHFGKAPFMRPQRGENENLHCGNECNKRPLKKLSEPSPTHLTWDSQTSPSPSSCMCMSALRSC